MHGHDPHEPQGPPSFLALLGCADTRNGQAEELQIFGKNVKEERDERERERETRERERDERERETRERERERERGREGKRERGREGERERGREGERERGREGERERGREGERERGREGERERGGSRPPRVHLGTLQATRAPRLSPTLPPSLQLRTGIPHSTAFSSL